MENRINIGDLDTLVKIQSCTVGRGSAGQKTYDFSDHSEVWAKIDRLSDEAVSNLNLEDGQSLTVTIYKIAEMNTRWRVIVDGKPYGVTAINPISRFSPLCTVSLEAIV